MRSVVRVHLSPLAERSLKKFAVTIRSGETPVLIPNTTVKPGAAESTLLETAREDRWLQLHGGVAQLGEHLPCKQGVMSSNLTISIQLLQLIESLTL